MLKYLTLLHHVGHKLRVNLKNIKFQSCEHTIRLHNITSIAQQSQLPVLQHWVYGLIYHWSLRLIKLGQGHGSEFNMWNHVITVLMEQMTLKIQNFRNTIFFENIRLFVGRSENYILLIMTWPGLLSSSGKCSKDVQNSNCGINGCFIQVVPLSLRSPFQLCNYIM